MPTWQFTVPDNLLSGIAHARAKANAEKPDGATDPFPTDFSYVQQRMFDAINSWEAQRQAEAAIVAPPVPAPVSGVPQEVTRRQAIQALIDFNMIALVQPAIDAIADPAQRLTMQNEWDNSTTFQRQRPTLIALAKGALGMTDAQLDNLFIYAATK